MASGRHHCKFISYMRGWRWRWARNLETRNLSGCLFKISNWSRGDSSSHIFVKHYNIWPSSYVAVWEERYHRIFCWHEKHSFHRLHFSKGFPILFFSKPITIYYHVSIHHTLYYSIATPSPYIYHIPIHCIFKKTVMAG